MGDHHPSVAWRPLKQKLKENQQEKEYTRE